MSRAGGVSSWIVDSRSCRLSVINRREALRSSHSKPRYRICPALNRHRVYRSTPDKNSHRPTVSFRSCYALSTRASDFCRLVPPLLQLRLIPELRWRVAALPRQIQSKWLDTDLMGEISPTFPRPESLCILINGIAVGKGITFAIRK